MNSVKYTIPTTSQKTHAKSIASVTKNLSPVIVRFAKALKPPSPIPSIASKNASRMNATKSNATSAMK
jgi:hypothetical protein